jgi:hypothetical protein
MMVAAVGLPMPKLIMVIPFAVADCMGLSIPTTSTLFQVAKSSTYLLKLVSRIYCPNSDKAIPVYLGSQLLTISSLLFIFWAFQFEITDYFASMVELVFPEPDFKIREQNGRPELFDVIRSKWVALGPEEWVRQNFIQWMVKVNQIPLSAIAVEKQLKLGKESKRFDVLVYNARLQPWMMVECKSMDVKLDESVLMQLLSYHVAIPVDYLVITNGITCHVAEKKNGTAEWVPFFPKY